MAVRNDEGEIVNWYRGIVESVERATKDELERTMREGAELTIGYIATRGTAKSKRAGRIDSGDMIRDVSHRVDQMQDGRSRGFFGWLNAPNDPDKKYYVYQEGGFTHWRSGELIEGMYAVADAATQVFGDLQKRMAAAVAKANAPMFTKRVRMFGKETKSG